ncbi:hypothetical protein [Streptomyces nymphaeiformis]|uniref:Uncharacterized protein n=1 Tax=Streptomyces nymphaeiformis TaxID=2663842 RepID=A0A7W7U4R8_9ACTN|nr:hypothetical protein [Streptomyces nymphaeiformis]MBB4984981.1 hypothetical protein [Streptomyces nymphaeiformis]
MTDQPTACSSTRHCARHGFCHRCAPDLADASQYLVKAMSAARIDDERVGALYAQLAATVRDAARQASGQQPDTCHPIDVDGATVLVRGSGDWTDEDRAHAAELARAARRRFESEPRCPSCKHLWTNHQQGACVIRSRSQGVAAVCGCTETESAPAAGLSDTQPAVDRVIVRCTSCEHQDQYHDADGRCWFTVEHGVPERDLVCPCKRRRLTVEEDETR